MSYRYPARRAGVEPAGVAKLRADEVAECPPHYWVVKDAAQTCRKCGVRLGIGRDGRVVLPERVEVAAEPAEPAAAPAADVEPAPAPAAGVEPALAPAPDSGAAMAEIKEG